MVDLTWDSYRYRVRSGRAVTPVIRELWLTPVEAPMPFAAGQFLLLSDARGLVPQRSYSVANAPRPGGALSLLVTRVVGGATSTWAHGLAAGDEVSVEGPFGTFVARRDESGPVVLLGAGSGLAPVRALVEQLLASPPGYDAAAAPAGADPAATRAVTLLFSGRTRADLIDRERFTALAAADPRFGYRPLCTRENHPAAAGAGAAAPGAIADSAAAAGGAATRAGEARHARLPEILPRQFRTLTGHRVFASGPPGFVAGCRDAALALGADPAQVLTEEFYVE